MKPSKLEAYYVETFGERDASEGDPTERPTPRTDRPRRRRERGGFGSRLVLKLCLMFGPMAILGLVAMTTECGPRSSTTMIPEFLRSTACARATLMSRASGLDGTFRTIADTLR